MGEEAVFFKELPPEAIPRVDLNLSDGTTISLASNSELPPLDKLKSEQELFLTMFPYLGDHVFVKTTVRELMDVEKQLLSTKNFKRSMWPQIQENFGGTLEKLPGIFEGMKKGEASADQQWQEFMEDCMLIAVGHKILDKVDVMVLLEHPKSDSRVQKEFPVFRIKA
jgi:hypothetical protein